MGWRERDWAKLTDAERQALWGASTQGNARRVTVRSGAGLAVIASAVLFAAGQFPTGHPLAPALHFKLPVLLRGTPVGAESERRGPVYFRLRGPRTVPVGTRMIVSGAVDHGVTGASVMLGRWKPGGWKVLGSAFVGKGSYAVHYRLRHRGVVRLRLVLPDGHVGRGMIRVVRH